MSTPVIAFINPLGKIMKRSQSIVMWLAGLLVAVGCLETFAQDKDDTQEQRWKSRGQSGQRMQGGRNRVDNGLKVGEVAPLFELKSLDGTTETKLADFRGKKPVVLFFGSYT